MIGLGIVTYSRPDYLDQCLFAATQHSFGGATKVRVGIDFKDQDTSDKLESICKKYNVAYFKYTKNVGVGVNKNGLMRELLNEKCEHLFLMEDDILIAYPGVCKAYIDEAKRLGIKHMNFALHGNMNKNPRFKKLYPMPNGTRATVFPHCVGAFSYYHKDYIQEVGYMDERFMNAWEHVEHTFKGCQMKLNPPFWYFVDHPASDKMLKEIPGSNHNSSIGVRPEHQENVKKGQQYWLHKWGMWLPQFPDKFYGW